MRGVDAAPEVGVVHAQDGRGALECCGLAKGVDDVFLNHDQGSSLDTVPHRREETCPCYTGLLVVEREVHVILTIVNVQPPHGPIETRPIVGKRQREEAVLVGLR